MNWNVKSFREKGNVSSASSLKVCIFAAHGEVSWQQNGASNRSE